MAGSTDGARDRLELGRWSARYVAAGRELTPAPERGFTARVAVVELFSRDGAGRDHLVATVPALDLARRRVGWPDGMGAPGPRDLASLFAWAADLLAADHSRSYMLLSRLVSDCEYFLGFGGANEGDLWARSIDAQVSKMREAYDSLPIEPEWLTREQIDDYGERMRSAVERERQGMRR